ncbi:MAG: DUF2917 domain-containing protein [Pseudomonadota bacterium]
MASTAFDPCNPLPLLRDCGPDREVERARANFKAAATAPVALQPGAAVSFNAKRAGLLRVASGRVWATVSNAALDARVQGGDHVLGAGQTLSIRAGDKVVAEVIADRSPAWLAWEPEDAAASRWKMGTVFSPGAWFGW